MALAIASFTTGWRNAHRYWYTSFFVLLGVVEVESGLEPSKRRLSLDFFFSFLEKLPIGWYLSKYGITCNDGEVSETLSQIPVLVQTQREALARGATIDPRDGEIHKPIHWMYLDALVGRVWVIRTNDGVLHNFKDIGDRWDPATLHLPVPTA
jgi:hypothetical protein